MHTQIEQVLSSLHSRHLNGIYAKDHEEAKEKVLSLIPEHAVVGIGDSTAIRQLGLPQVLKVRGLKVLNGYERKELSPNPEKAEEDRRNIVKQATLSDVFLTGTNAITQDGRLVNVDAQGNRVAGMFWGHPTSIIVIGRNKIVKDLDEAFRRIREIIAPTHFRTRTVDLGGRKMKTPCVETGECTDCRAKDRGCNIFTIIEGKPYRTDLHVVLVNQDLGLGWDPSWPNDRIMKIRENYKKFVWVPLPTNT
jgi:hypothetical protein